MAESGVNLNAVVMQLYTNWVSICVFYRLVMS